MRSVWAGSAADGALQGAVLAALRRKRQVADLGARDPAHTATCWRLSGMGKRTQPRRFTETNSEQVLGSKSSRARQDLIV